jgi:predicted ATP-grasp superfamily ATP-dependent carboligase
MRILVYEHITGGGMLEDARISALAAEGDLMLRALVRDLSVVPGVEVSVLRDFRLPADVPATMHIVGPGAFDEAFRRAISGCDAVWPIAPETGGILLRITREIASSGRWLLGSSGEAIAIAASKRATAAVLAGAGVAAAGVYAKPEEIPAHLDAVVAKPDDGAGCQETFLFTSREKLHAWSAVHATANTLYQPYLRGEARSLCLLCCTGRARLLACNRQQVQVIEGAFRFEGVSVNAVADEGGRYAALAGAVCAALPGLWGFCGVDFVETAAGPVVIEVNPRLTTAYAGLRGAIGLNCAQLVLELPGSLCAEAPPARHSHCVDLRVAHAH